MAIAAFEFNTERLAFRVWQDHHCAPFAAMNCDPEVMRFFPALLSAEQSNAGIDRWRQQFQELGWSNWAVEKLDTGEFLGFIGLSVPVQSVYRDWLASEAIGLGARLRHRGGKRVASSGV